MNAGLQSFDLDEWKEIRIPDLRLTPKDQILREQLSGEAGRVEIDELVDGLRVRARSWVGVVRFEGFELRIHPKLAGGEVGLIHLLTFTSGLNALRRNLGERLLRFEEHGNLFDLLALLLAEACEKLVNGGLLSDFVEQELDLPVLRGRILVTPQIRRRMGQLDRIECRYDDHSSDILENQILAAALTVASKRVQHSDVRRRVLRMSAIFSAICRHSQLDLQVAKNNLTYHRLNSHYYEAHQLAWLVFGGLQIDDLLAVGSTRSFAFLLDMNQLFEQFIYHYAEWVLRGTHSRVHYQRKDRSILWNLLEHRPYSNIIPDLLVENDEFPGNCLAIDAKYKLYDNKKISSEDIYQSFLYAFAYSERETTRPRALLLYPTNGTSEVKVDIQVRDAAKKIGAGIHVMGINLLQALAEVNTENPGQTTHSLLDLIRQSWG